MAAAWVERGAATRRDRGRFSRRVNDEEEEKEKERGKEGPEEYNGEKEGKTRELPERSRRLAIAAAAAVAARRDAARRL